MIYTIGWCLCRWIARHFFALQVEGAERVPGTGPVILAPNHVSYLDPVLVGVSIRRRVHFMAKKELFRNRLAAWFLRGLQAYPVARGRLDPSTLKHALSLLKNGEVLLIFPEGTRGDGRTLGPAKPGIAAVAARAGAPVVPVFHWGTDQALPRTRQRIRRVPLAVRFGPPLRFAGDVEDGRNAVESFGGQIMDAIAALRESGRPPIIDCK
ncbi:MAG TPA: lysophospholipid acyltransferase family protein [Candidatus Methylomirabilis sp.]|nr:lysophospholipid acyltransferase family protein [Candidatus Methylomirabilis sp.]